MIVISDTSPITNLLSIDMIDILKKLYNEVIIPERVNTELRVTHTDLPKFIKVDYIKNKSALKKLQKEIDYGEAEAIRKIALREGINIIGLVGVLISAKKQGYIRSVRKVIELLESKAGFWISPQLKKQIIIDINENLNF